MDTEQLWLQVWQEKLGHIIAFSVFLLLILLVMIFRDRVAKNKTALNLIKYSILSVSFVYVGVVLKAQPSTANILILHTAAESRQFPLGLFLLEPFLFLSFTFIVFTMLVWGRGVFCGWLCPYGAMLELINKLYDKISKFRLSLPERVHWKLVYLKYVLFAVIIGIGFYNFFLAEYLTEIEPFRTFVLKLKRQWYFVSYFVILTAGSVVIYRAFCRYLCPLGAAIAMPSFLKFIPFIKLRRYDFCQSCKICPRTCKPDAISANGFINSRECLSCLDCQVNFWDEDKCPVLIKRKKAGTG